jgi:vanillate/3-O-methylgallate O-demethylase
MTEQTMAGSSLEEQIAQFASPLEMLRRAPVALYVFPMASEYTTWRDEQWAWKNTCTLYDQSHHMTDFYFKGPDIRRLFSDVAVNDFEKFGGGKAKQFLAVNEDGYVVADAILFGFSDDEWVLVGTPIAPNWVAYHAETGDYDVEVVRDHFTPANPTGRLTFRYQLNGPKTQAIVEAASGGTLDRVKFFNMGTCEIAGAPVRALNHTMAGVPGQEMTGLELIGPAEHGKAVLAAIMEAGREFGLRQGGARSYVSATFESGWIPSPLPAIYTGDSTKGYRQWMGSMSLEGHAALSGSFVSDKLEDYYLTPWDLGYGHLIKFNHDFIGREALERMADQPHRRKVWLNWNDDDVLRIMAGSIYGEGERAKFIDLPNTNYNHFQYDAVLDGDAVIGISTYGGYTVNLGRNVSLAMVDETKAVDGAEVALLWGEPAEELPRGNIEPHVQTRIRATISTTSPAL